MTILGPLVAPRTSTVTPALSRPEAVTCSPSTTMTTGRVSDSPTPVSTLSISMTSPTATFCCLLPARTTAYTAGSLSSGLRTSGKLRACRGTTATRSNDRGSAPRRRWGRAHAHRGPTLLARRSQGQNEAAPRAGIAFRCVAQPSTRARTSRLDKDHPNYRWVALSNTTLGILMATINSSIVIISLPAIFRGIDLNPLEPGNVSYLLWIIMGFLVVSAVLVVTLGRLGDMFGRVKMYNLGFLVFSVFSVLLSVDPFTGGSGAMWLIVMRIGQGVGGAMLFANSTAILTDAFPAEQRGMALGINQVSAIAGSFLGLVIGGLLSEWHWRAVFWVSVPIGILGTVWGYKSLVELGERRKSKVDVPGNLTFGLGLTALLVAITYGIQP